MKKLAILFLLIASLRASADFVTVLNVETAGKTQETTLKFKDTKSRIDISDKVSSITNLTSGEMTILLPAGKKFKTLSRQQIMERRQAELQGDSPTPIAPPVITDTGKTEKIGDHTAEIYTSETPAAKFTFWLTKDWPDFAAINAEVKKYQTLESAMYKGDNLYVDFSKIDGVIVKFTVELKSGKTITTTLISTKVQPVDDAAFQVPADYTELSLPTAPSAPPVAGGSPASAATATPKP